MLINIDPNELRLFVADLGDMAAAPARKVRAVVSKGALNIKNELQAEMRKSRHFGQIARTIDYDLNADVDGVEAVIGPNKRYDAANLAHFAYFGGAHGGGGTVADPNDALENEIPKFEKALGDIVDGR